LPKKADKPKQAKTSEKTLAEIFPDLPEDIDLDDFDAGLIPEHLAVIMDGNGRWATARGMNRVQGHTAGIKAVRELIQTANDIGVRYLTIYSFSTENWARPKAEVTALMTLFAQTMAAELSALHEKGVRVEVIGDLSTLPVATQEVFISAIAATTFNRGMRLIVALNYSGRQEILRAVREVARAAMDGDLEIDAMFADYDYDDDDDDDAENTSSELAFDSDLDSIINRRFEDELFTAGYPDPDLLIRTSGEYRLSNFMLYQLAYTELYFTPVLWPDFDRYELLRAILDYQKRNRRYGGLT